MLVGVLGDGRAGQEVHVVAHQLIGGAAADVHRQVVGGDVDVHQPGFSEDRADPIGRGQRERAGRIGIHRIGRAQHLGHRPARFGDPGVLLGRPPAHEGQPPPGPQRPPEVGETGHRLGEEHDPHTREGGVEVPGLELVGAGIGHHKLGVGQTGVDGPAPGLVQHGRRHVHPGHMTCLAHQAGQLQAGGAGAAPDVQHVLAGVGVQPGDGSLSQGGEHGVQPLPILHPHRSPVVPIVAKRLCHVGHRPSLPDPSGKGAGQALLQRAGCGAGQAAVDGWPAPMRPSRATVPGGETCSL